MIFTVTACDTKGVLVSVEVDAEDKARAQASARSQGLMVVSVAESRADSVGKARLKVPRKVRGSGKKITQFARELSVLVGTGTPIAESLRAIERQAREPGWKMVVSSVRESVEEGTSLSVALGAHPDVFDATCCSLVAAGETSGRLDDLLRRLAKMKRHELKSRSLLIASATYPAVLITISGCVMIAMVLFVIPRFAGLFETLNAPLPWTTKLLLDMSDLFKQFWWLAILAFAALGVGLRFGSKSEKAQMLADRALSRAPLFGPFSRGFTVAKMMRLLGVLLDAKVSMLESLELVRRSVRRPLYVRWADEATDLVTRGESLSGSFGNDVLFTPAIQEAITNGEKTGRISDVLIDLSEYLDDENEAAARTFANLLEPIIMVALGVVVALVALSMFLPLFDLTASVGR